MSRREWDISQVFTTNWSKKKDWGPPKTSNWSMRKRGKLKRKSKDCGTSTKKSVSRSKAKRKNARPSSKTYFNTPKIWKRQRNMSTTEKRKIKKRQQSSVMQRLRLSGGTCQFLEITGDLLQTSWAIILWQEALYETKIKFKSSTFHIWKKLPRLMQILSNHGEQLDSRC